MVVSNGRMSSIFTLCPKYALFGTPYLRVDTLNDAMNLTVSDVQLAQILNSIWLPIGMMSLVKVLDLVPDSNILPSILQYQIWNHYACVRPSVRIKYFCFFGHPEATYAVCGLVSFTAYSATML